MDTQARGARAQTRQQGPPTVDAPDLRGLGDLRTAGGGAGLASGVGGLVGDGFGDLLSPAMGEEGEGSAIVASRGDSTA